MIYKQIIRRLKKIRHKFYEIKNMTASLNFTNINPVKYFSRGYLTANLLIRFSVFNEIFKKERNLYFFEANTKISYRNIKFFFKQALILPLITFLLIFIYPIILIKRSFGNFLLILILSFLAPYPFVFGHKLNVIVTQKKAFNNFCIKLFQHFGHNIIKMKIGKNTNFISLDNRQIIMETISTNNYKDFIYEANKLALNNIDFFEKPEELSLIGNSILNEVINKRFELRTFFKNNFKKAIDVMDTYDLNLFLKEDAKEWDEFIKNNCPNAIFHYSSHLKNFSQSSFVCKKIMGDIDINAIDLILLKKNLGIKYSGPILKSRSHFKKESTFQEYQSKIIRSIARTRIMFKEYFHEVFKTDHTINELSLLGQKILLRETFVIEILKDKQELFLNLETKIRTDIRKAIKSNLYVENYKPDEFKKNMMTEFEEIPSIFNYIDELDSEIYDIYISIVKEKNLIISGALIIGSKAGDTLFYINALKNKKNRRGGSQSLAIWNIIENAPTNYKYLDFLGSRDARIRRFFRGFGGKIYNKKELC